MAVQCSVTLAVALWQAHYMKVSVNVNVSMKVDVQENALRETMEACTYT